MVKTREELLLSRQVLLHNYLSCFTLIDVGQCRGVRKKIEQEISKIDEQLGEMDKKEGVLK